MNTELNPTRFDLIAEAYGCLGIRMKTAADLGPALDKAFATEVPVVVDAIIDRDATLALRAGPKLRFPCGHGAGTGFQGDPRAWIPDTAGSRSLMRLRATAWTALNALI